MGSEKREPRTGTTRTKIVQPLTSYVGRVLALAHATTRGLFPPWWNARRCFRTILHQSRQTRNWCILVCALTGLCRIPPDVLEHQRPVQQRPCTRRHGEQTEVVERSLRKGKGIQSSIPGYVKEEKDRQIVQIGWRTIKVACLRIDVVADCWHWC